MRDTPVPAPISRPFSMCVEDRVMGLLRKKINILLLNYPNHKPA